MTGRMGRRKGMIRSTTAAVAALAVLAGCAPASATTPTPVATAAVTPTPAILDSGPTDAVTAAFTTAVAGDMSDQFDFLACVAGGTDATTFSNLFGGLAELALAMSGVDPEAYRAAVGLSFGDFSATETSRTDDQAMVQVRMAVAIEPNVVALRELMRGIPSASPAAVDDELVDALVYRLVGRETIQQAVDQEVIVSRTAGTWRVCES